MVKKEVVVIASVLKPVDDTRMYEKMAQSLARTGKFRVNILGFFSNTHSAHRDIEFHPIFQFKRNHYRRLIANLIFYKALSRYTPQVIIVTTPELAPATLVYKFLHSKVNVFYDMVENYSLNLLHHHQRHTFLRGLLAKVITYWEKQLLKKSKMVLVAEKGYYQEKPGLSSFRTLLLENKVSPSIKVSKKQQSVKEELSLVYTGTISPAYGIWDALRLIEQLRNVLVEKLTFHLIGHVTQTETYDRLVKYLNKHSWIQATISQHPIPHQQLLDVIQQADFGLVCHKLLPSIRHCFPTRIWEYMACGLPFILQDHALWVDYCQPWHCAIPLNFSQSEWPVTSLIKRLYQEDFYPNGISESIYWEEQPFLSAIIENG